MVNYMIDQNIMDQNGQIRCLAHILNLAVKDFFSKIILPNSTYTEYASK